MVTEGRNPPSQRVSECRRARGRGEGQSGLRSSSVPSWCLSCCGNVYVGAGDKGPLPPTSPLFTLVRGIGILRTSPFGDSRKFATRKPRPSNNKDSPFE